MPVSRSYRCLNCMDHAVERSFDVSHLSLRCTDCGEFGRFVNARVLDQFDAFEADPPAELDWASLDRTRKLLVAEQVARRGRSVADMAPDDREPPDERVSGDGGTSGGDGTGVTDGEGVAAGGRDAADGDGQNGTDGPDGANGADGVE